MKKAAVLTTIFVMSFSFCFAQQEEKFVRKDIPNLYGRTNFFKVKEDESWGFYIYIPADYTETKKWPLFIGVHGSGGDGNGAMEWWRTPAYKEGFILVCPNFIKGHSDLSGNTDKQLIAIIEQVREDFSVEEKAFIAGFSAGAQFAERFTVKYPQYIKAVSLMAGGSYDLPSRSDCKKMRNIKFLIMVGGDDKKTRKDVARLLMERLEKNDCDVRVKVFPYVGHTMCKDAINETIGLFKGS